ncbi:MAG: precorrin-6A synthase (deacetylating) [Corynebacterium sp.]|nr:precorrin-6A synthase (deacetylating) [Corynebacterium sp.]
MRRIMVIGIGAGSPDHLTLGAIKALQQADVVIAIDKGEEKHDLLGLRKEILAAHNSTVPLRTVLDPPRNRKPDDYYAEVQRWHQARAEAVEQAIVDATDADGTAAILVWGDPALYDSTLRILERFSTPIAITVIPGITAIQALTAAHHIVLNRIGEEIVITTGRKLMDGARHRNCIVMLDGGTAWLTASTPHTYMWWGAYLGTDKEIIRSGPAQEIGSEVAKLKTHLRQQHGWIMDIYMLRELD